MKTLQWNTVDKLNWADGPWKTEPDKMQWQDEATGLPCLIHRNGSGALCGYVGVPEGHKAYQKDYDDVDVDAHGGLTYAGQCADTKDESHGICHLAEQGEPQHVWWLGFDCAHSGDICPRYDFDRSYPIADYESYKTVEYVRNEVTNLARQIAAMS